MKKLIVAGCVSALFACSNTNEFDANLDSQVSKKGTQAATPSNQANTTAPPLPSLNPAVTPPVTTQPVVTSTPVTTQPASTAAGMNPPHGQPGHRCDIEVGAPLSSAPKQQAPKTATATTTTPQNITVTPVTPQTKTAAGMNPPHGQPGHRCDIEVGAPLNSAPKAATNVTPVTPVKTEEVKTAPLTEQWKVDLKDKGTKKDSTRN